MGAGLPSLEELGLTTEQLFTTSPSALAPRDNEFTQVTRCRTPSEGSEYVADVDDVIACYNYLVALGDYTCRERELCRIGSAKITGISKNGHTWSWGVPFVFTTVKCVSCYTQAQTRLAAVLPFLAQVLSYTSTSSSSSGLP
ncbi:hypothetical protein VC83_03588 [Pseudogymnoascus destructans]|uniref:Uncharacterized protein n=1 Tax=Pseudogymnoascus destructans TaxID=655981 RepID=A0A177AF01_9PEZI|nr:uncharacterized protein VC83_03588 [Pseudogymnoascus destructans]OAF60685.1 hypothetical protein VC83_03588 [Pseudogymnoascus destructans]